MEDNSEASAQKQLGQRAKKREKERAKRKEKEDAEADLRQKEEERVANSRFAEHFAPRGQFQLQEATINFVCPEYASGRIIRIRTAEDWATATLQPGINVVEFTPDLDVRECVFQPTSSFSNVNVILAST
jgi:hypothetical protein